MDRAAILRDYRALRQASIALHTRLAKTLTSQDIGIAAAALGMRRGKNIDLETEDEISVLMDHAIYDVVRDGRNAVDRLIEDDPPPEGSMELRLLHSMQKARYTIFEVQTPIPGFGVRGLEGPERNPVLLVDLGFSATAVPGLVLATRIHSPGEGWWVATGAALPLNPKALTRIIRELSDHQRRFGAEPAERERAAMIIRACVASGASRQINYAAPGERILPKAASPTLRPSPKIGRNDPCPCGIGRKYKKCCET
jgi:hypothetical protein